MSQVMNAAADQLKPSKPQPVKTSAFKRADALKVSSSSIGLRFWVFVSIGAVGFVLAQFFGVI